MTEQTLTDAEIETGGFARMEAEADADGTDGDADGTAVAVRGFDAASVGGGSVALVGGQLRYTPAAGFTGAEAGR